jgi:DNA-3-methyladenine glycosylase
MFGPAGHLYVYFTYGMHYCCNVVTGPEGHGSAVLVRAVEPLEGADIMSVNRKGRGGKGGLELTNGPAKLCQAFGIDAQWNGHDLSQPPLLLLPYERTLTGSGAIGGLGTRDIVQTTRIGISQATDVAWRFYIKDNPYVSRQ